jgi:hypothetical protein
MSFTTVKPAHPPTTVNFALPCSFTGRGVRNLAVVRNNLLQLYVLRVRSDDTEENAISVAKLELVKECVLFGTVIQLEVVRPHGSTTDRLLLAFGDAQVSVLSWDPNAFGFSTVAIHNFENPQLLVGRPNPTATPPMLRVDPQNRCAALLFYGCRLQIIPIGAGYQRVHMDEDTGNDSQSSSGQFTINLEAMDILHVGDFTFLDGCLEPTISILYEHSRTWTGRLAAQKATCAVKTLSISLGAKEHNDIWSATDLPYNCLMFCPVAAPTKGAMLIALNSIWYLNPNSSTKIAVAVNEFGLLDLQASKQDGSLGGPNDLSDAAVSLQACSACFLDPHRALLNLSRGQMICVELITEVHSVVSFAINREKSSVLTSCACKLTDQLIFLGSRLGDSHLVEFYEKTDEGEREGAGSEQSAASVLQVSNPIPFAQWRSEIMGPHIQQAHQKSVANVRRRRPISMSCETYPDSVLNLHKTGLHIVHQCSILLFQAVFCTASHYVQLRLQTSTPTERRVAEPAAQSMTLRPNVKEQLHMVLMALRVALDKVAGKTRAGAALAELGPQLEGFLAEHGTESPGLREVCAMILLGCGWDLGNNKFLEETGEAEDTPTEDGKYSVSYSCRDLMF